MIDYQEGRLWADHHKAFSAWIGAVSREIIEAFQVLARLQYDQPWKRETMPVKARAKSSRAIGRAID